MKVISSSSGATPSRLAYWLVAAIAVLLVVFAITEIPRSPVSLAVLTAPAHVELLPAASSSHADDDAPGGGVPEASAVFRGRETSPEEPTPTF